MDLKIKCFAVDVDGTITEDGGRLDLEAVHALRWLEGLGCKVVLVSGRSAWELYALTVFLGLTRMAVAENGGVVVSSPRELLLLADKSPCLEAYEVLAEEIKQVKIRPVFPRLTEVVVERNFDIEEARRILEERRLRVTVSDSNYGYHICQEGVDKAKGFSEVLKKLGISWDDTVAIGDSETDVSLFEKSGYSVAMGQSPQVVKEKAKYAVKGRMGRGFSESVKHVADNFLKEKAFPD